MTSTGSSLRAGDVMSPHLVTTRPDATVEEAVTTMLERRISGLPVVDDSGRLVGMITEGDLLRRQELGTEKRHPRWLRFFLSPGRLAEEYTQSRGRKVSELMTREVVSAKEATPLAEVIDLMSRHRVKRIPVLMGDGPIGIVSRADVLRALSRSFAQRNEAAPRSDDQLLAEIKAEFERAECVPTALIEVEVRDGEAYLIGAVTDERERSAVRVAVENVPGVKAIHDRMVWVDPLSGITLPPPDEAGAAKPAR